ncbi:protein HAPLESS 2 isoform X2 [Tripterygium wilfordii]|uniref:protein HAPLESS 2 isoform X2 n=1 Tax=Tripterygium wilfordii TaxID=458696 RepID=UPI0018F85050|nr:protein HAPLESS 2 isoform X2 [Tripterygium wilfordii]
MRTKTLEMAHLVAILTCVFILQSSVVAVQILSKSKLEKCEKVSDSDSLNCTRKVVLNMAVPSGSSGGEASIVAELVEVEENSTSKMQTLRVPPVITVNKSASYALYELMYIRDVPYKPQEYYVNTRKCEPDAGADVVKTCERLRDENGDIIEHTQPVCCPCGPQRRVPSSCGNFFDKLMKGKANTAHCLRFPGDWFHVYGIGQRSIGFTVRIEIKVGSMVSEVIVGPENRTAISKDRLLRVNLIGDFVGYTSIPSFEDFYLVIPRQGGPGQPQNLGTNISTWMLLERVRFTLDGIECNKIGVSYEAFNGQPNFCSSPFWSCLHNQLWNFQDADQNRISRNQLPLYGLEGRFERINQHPDAGTHSFSIGVTEVLNTNVLIELTADDIEYVYQRSSGKILSVTIPTFEALTQLGVATITTKNTGDVEASYSLTFDCSKGIGLMEEQFFIMKPKEIASRSFKLYPSTHQAAKYMCAAILKDAEFSEVDRAECQFSTTATVYDNGSQMPFEEPETSMSGFFDSIESIWNKLWHGLLDFFSGKTCRSKCTGFLDFSCHIQYICMSWMVMFGLLLAIFPTVLVLLWLLHQKGLFDPLYDWWEDHFVSDKERDGGNPRQNVYAGHPHTHLNKHHEQKLRHHKHGTYKQRSVHNEHRHNHSGGENDYYYYLHHVHKDNGKNWHGKNSSIERQIYLDGRENRNIGRQRHKKQRKILKAQPKLNQTQ